MTVTTGVRADDGPARRPSDGRIGALAAVTPIAMCGLWNAYAGWSGTATGFALAMAGIALSAAVAGWIVGGRVGRSLVGYILGIVAFTPVGYLVLLPLAVIGSSWESIQAGGLANALDLVGAVAAYLVYGVVSAVYVSLFLLPFSAAWMVTFLLMRRAFDR